MPLRGWMAVIRSDEALSLLIADTVTFRCQLLLSVVRYYSDQAVHYGLTSSVGSRSSYTRREVNGYTRGVGVGKAKRIKLEHNLRCSTDLRQATWGCWPDYRSHEIDGEVHVAAVMTVHV